MKHIGKLVLLALLGPALAYLIKPLAHVERLNDARLVKAATEDALILEDGRRVALPMIRRIPNDDPIFAEALAQGVEDAATLELLASWGCDQAQGFFFRRPLPPADFAAWMQASACGRAGGRVNARRSPAYK